jgi:hypothetical protein
MRWEMLIGSEGGDPVSGRGQVKAVAFIKAYKLRTQCTGVAYLRLLQPQLHYMLTKARALVSHWSGEAIQNFHGNLSRWIFSST